MLCFFRTNPHLYVLFFEPCFPEFYYSIFKDFEYWERISLAGNF